jgi:hypothetical protein
VEKRQARRAGARKAKLVVRRCTKGTPNNTLQM